jgi:hypothetical protein
MHSKDDIIGFISIAAIGTIAILFALAMIK